MPSGVRYECTRCGNCCRWPGFVAVSNEEIGDLADHLGFSEDDFIQCFTRLRPNREGLALIDNEHGECVFLSGQDCLVQPVKPRQCRRFPNEWNQPGWRETCQAVPVESVA